MKEWLISIILIALCVLIGFMTIANYEVPAEDLTAGPPWPTK